MPFRKSMLIVNPYSGRGLAKSVLGGIVSQLCDSGYAVTVHITKDRNTKQLAEEYGGQYDLIICVGGDGTLSDVVSGLMTLDAPPPVGYIPTGTANDMATTLALSRNPQLAVQSVLDGEPTPLDVGRFGDEYFTYIAAFGAFTGVSYQTTQSAKRALGHLAYVLGGLAVMSAIKPLHTVVEYSGGTVEGNFIFGGVTNSTSVAGLVRLDPKTVSLGDGQFEVLLVKNPVNLLDLGDTLASIFNQTYTSDNVQLLHTDVVRFTFDEDVMWTRDGENGGAHRIVEIQNCPRAMNIMI
ncbi:MAG: YegS/Rv2252/BmrU family lipid kinase [Oscillospiraceae bacterium]|jgi:YegS/Rv2252/BmrU family lipid kinase|nr:YegS/Rv2252/BmrU family lipid kinase [Oscillospiraceae bacterium]